MSDRTIIDITTFESLDITICVWLHAMDSNQVKLELFFYAKKNTTFNNYVIIVFIKKRGIEMKVDEKIKIKTMRKWIDSHTGGSRFYANKMSRKYVEKVEDGSLTEHEGRFIDGWYSGESFLSTVDALISQLQDDPSWQVIDSNVSTKENKGNFAFGISKKLISGEALYQVLQFFRSGSNENYLHTVSKGAIFFPKDANFKFANQRRENQFVSLDMLYEFLEEIERDNVPDQNGQINTRSVQSILLDMEKQWETIQQEIR